MIVVNLITKDTTSLLFLDNLREIIYTAGTGELLFVGPESVRPVYLDKGLSQPDVISHVGSALRPAYDPRALQTHAVLCTLDLRVFQTKEEEF